MKNRNWRKGVKIMILGTTGILLAAVIIIFMASDVFPYGSTYTRISSKYEKRCNGYDNAINYPIARFGETLR